MYMNWKYHENVIIVIVTVLNFYASPNADYSNRDGVLRGNSGI